MALFVRPKPVVGTRGIHLDLKGLPPTPKRLLEILDLLAEARVNCVLVEWEDTYPWTCHPELRSETAYSVRTVRRFLDRAEDLGIDVVPLVQCFGHLENVLSKEKHRRLRERPEVVGDICPSHRGALPVIVEMVEDVLKTHAGRVRRFHLGGDEVWSLGSCRRCAKVVEEKGKAELYLRHVEPLLDRLGAEGVTPILWDDMMRHWPPKLLRRLAPKADLMCWSYAADPFKWLKPEHLERYAAAGIGMWGGAAFKGADGAQTSAT